MTGLGGAGNQFQGGINDVVSSLLSGGGATDQAGNVNKNYQDYKSALSPVLQASYLDPRNTPGFGDALSTINNDITGQINSSAAAAGRGGSGYATQNLARGLSQGEGGLIQQQYNVNAGNQLGAINSLYNAGNTNAGLLAGMQQQAVANQQAGIGGAGTAFDMSTAGPLLQLQAQSMTTGIPLQNLAQMAGIAMPAAQQFGTQTGTGTTSGTSTSSGTSQGTANTTTQNTSPLWQQIAGGVLGAGSMLGGNQGLLAALGLGGPTTGTANKIG